MSEDKTPADALLVVQKAAKECWQVMSKTCGEFEPDANTKWLLMARVVNVLWVQFYSPIWPNAAMEVLKDAEAAKPEPAKEGV